MTIIAAIILGVIQGITEYFPISSSGHLSLIPLLLEQIWPALDFSFQSNNFDILLHIATFIGLISALKFELWELSNQILKHKNYKVLQLMAVATIPLAVIGGIVFINFNNWQQPTWWGVFSLIAIGFWLIAYDLLKPADSKDNKLQTPKNSANQLAEIAKLNYWQALLIGVFEASSIVRGVSRSGVTFLGATLTGLNRQTALKLSFLLSIPVFVLLTGAEIALTIVKTSQYELDTMFNYLPETLVGMVVAAVSSYAAIKIFKNFIGIKGILIGFGCYRIILAAVLILTGTNS